MNRLYLLLFLVLLSGPLFADSAYSAGKRAFGAKQFGKARELFMQAYRANPSDGNPLFYLGYILEYENKKAESIEQYRKAVDLKMDPDLRDKAFWKIVLFYKYRQDWDLLYIYSDKFLKYKSSSDVRNMRDLAERNRDPVQSKLNVHMNRGLEYSKAQKTKEAIEEYKKVLEIRPSYQPARWRLALAYMDDNKYKEASRELNRLKEEDKNSWEYRYKSGVCYYRMHEVSSALEDFQSARQLYKEKDKSSIFFMIFGEALAFAELGNLSAAEEKIKQAYKLNSSSLASGEMARILFLNGKKNEAVRLAEKTLEKEPAQRSALLTLVMKDLEDGNVSNLSRHVSALVAAIDRDYKPALPYSLHDVLLRSSLKLKGAGDDKLALRSLRMVDEDYVGSLATDEKYSYYIVMGDFYYAERKLPESIRYYEKAREKKESLWGLSRSYALLRDEANAMLYLDRASAIKKDYYKLAMNDSAFSNLSSGFKADLSKKAGIAEGK